MIPSGTAWFGNRPLGLMSKAVVLAAALLLCFLPLAVLAYLTLGMGGLTAAALAGMICLVAGLNGLGVSSVLMNLMTPQTHYSAVLAGTFVRMGLPLALFLFMTVKEHALLESGFAYWLIAFYQVMLFVEVVLLLPASTNHTRKFGN